MPFRNFFDKFDKRKQAKKEAKELKNRFFEKYAKNYDPDEVNGMFDMELEIQKNGIQLKPKVPFKRLVYSLKPRRQLDAYLKGRDRVYNQHLNVRDNNYRRDVYRNNIEKEIAKNYEQNEKPAPAQEKEPDATKKSDPEVVRAKSEAKIQEKQKQFEAKKQFFEAKNQEKELALKNKEEALQNAKNENEARKLEIAEIKAEQSKKIQELEAQESDFKKHILEEETAKKLAEAEIDRELVEVAEDKVKVEIDQEPKEVEAEPEITDENKTVQKLEAFKLEQENQQELENIYHEPTEEDTSLVTHDFEQE